MTKPDCQRIERLPSVMARTGMGRSWIYREAAAGRFPRPIKIGGATGWSAREIDGWLDALFANRPPHRTACDLGA